MRWQTSDRRACAGLCFRQGHVKVKFGDTASRQVQASKEEAAVSFYTWSSMRPQVCSLLRTRLLGGMLLAWGGCWSPPNCELDRASIKFFAVRVHRSDLPSWFCTDDEGKPVASLQSCICALEALAQLMRLDARLSEGQFRASLGRICVRQQCDNMGVACSASKSLSMRRPLCFVLQAPAAPCGALYAGASKSLGVARC